MRTYLFLLVFWAVVWGPDAMQAWRDRRKRKDDLADLRQAMTVEEMFNDRWWSC